MFNMVKELPAEAAVRGVGKNNNRATNSKLDRETWVTVNEKMQQIEENVNTKKKDIKTLGT